MLGALLIVLLVGVGVVGVFVAIIPALIALVFLHVGVQTVRGRTPDTLGNGIGSIGIGLLGIVAIIGSWVEGVAVFSHGVQSLALLVAGYLALSARADYKRWRERHAAQL